MKKMNGRGGKEKVPVTRTPITKVPVTAPKAPISNPIITPIKNPFGVISSTTESKPKADPYQPNKEAIRRTMKKTGADVWSGLSGVYRSYVANADDASDVAKKLARIAAIKKASLSNKKYNVGTSTVADPTINPILYGGGGGGVMVTPEKPSFFSSIPSIVWIILAVGGAWYVLKSSGKR